jgi:hypothetical protein
LFGTTRIRTGPLMGNVVTRRKGPDRRSCWNVYNTACRIHPKPDIVKSSTCIMMGIKVHLSLEE